MKEEIQMKSESGVIFNLQKFSLNDGPGIRTVVFMKGCPLHCQWCANPESQDSRVQVLWDRESCVGCGTCAGSCPRQAVMLKPEGPVIDRELCDGCGRCAAACPQGALRLEGEGKSVEEILAVCLQDQPFYEESGGGVTLSGGEPLMHPDFAAALLRELKAQKIHTAMETTGFATPAVFDRVAETVDYFLFDIKHWDEGRHIRGTGVSNTPILTNLGRAIAAGRTVLPRLPVIPGFNDSLCDARGFVRRLKEAGAVQVQLLPFHQLGENKYTRLGKAYSLAGVPALHEEDLADYRQVFLDAGIRAFF